MHTYLSVAEQLNILFESIHKPNGDTYTLQDVSRATGISVPALSQLKNGKITNPQLNTLREICHFFDVPLRYFDTSTVEECYAIINRGRDDEEGEGLSYLAHTAASLSPEAQRDLLKVIAWAKAAEERLEDGDSLTRLESYDE